jgi:hypothetical protein
LVVAAQRRRDFVIAVRGRDGGYAVEGFHKQGHVSGGENQRELLPEHRRCVIGIAGKQHREPYIAASDGLDERLTRFRGRRDRIVAVDQCRLPQIRAQLGESAEVSLRGIPARYVRHVRAFLLPCLGGPTELAERPGQPLSRSQPAWARHLASFTQVPGIVCWVVRRHAP